MAVRGKGTKKRQDHLFKAGHKVRRPGEGPAGANSKHKRTDVHQKPKVISCKGRRSRSFESHAAKRLRSKKSGKIENTNRLVHTEKLKNLWNSAIEGHAIQSSKCQKPKFTEAREIKRGLAVSQSLKCVNCRYVTPLHKLYNEVKLTPGRGARSAVPNVALVVALGHTTIGNDKARDILSAIDLPVPSESSMQKLAVHVKEATKTVAERGCAEKLELVCGKEKIVGLKTDMRYNTSRLSTSRRTGINQTSQGVTFAMEDKSGESYIVAADIQNKICRIGTQLRLKGIDVQCPGHDGCTASVHRFDSLSEKVAGQNIGKKMLDRGIIVSHVTSDGDAQCAKGVQEVTPTPVKRFADTTHLAETQLRRGKSVEWSETMFAGVKTKGKKNLCTQALAKDLKRRSVTVLRALHDKHRGKLDDIQHEAKFSIDAIIMCYQGDCEHCKGKITTACLGGAGEDSWPVRSSFLQEQKIDCLQMTKTDVVNMRNVLNMLLSPDSLDKTQLLTTTQANEAAHRLLSSKLPKNIKYSRNLDTRVDSTIEHWNQGPGKAVFRQHAELGLPTTKGQLRHLKRKQDRQLYKKRYNKSPSTLQLRRKGDCLLRQLKMEWKQQTESDYDKHQLDDPPDHSYSVVSTCTNQTYCTTNTLKMYRVQKKNQRQHHT